MSPDLDAFLYRLAREPDLLERFRNSPQQVVEEAQLSSHDREFVLSRNGEGIWAAGPRPPQPPVTVAAAE